jgi:CDP-6-deoxy-D-xylo-4-hexulose-3-dehydrase
MGSYREEADSAFLEIVESMNIPPPIGRIASDIRQHMALLDIPKEFVPGKTRIPLNVPTYGVEEVMEALDSLMTTWVTMGKKVKTFEAMFAEYIGKERAVMVNSGSSANLLALSTMNLQPGDEVITPALTWATAVFPIVQAGGTPVLVDVERHSYNISVNAIKDAISDRTVALMPVHLLGNPCDMWPIRRLAQRYNLTLIEDCCEAHGAEYHGRKVGSFGDIATFSFFFSHHISTIEGGMVLSDSLEWDDRWRSMRAHGWIRDMSTRDVIAAANPDIDPRFMFAFPGYNFRPTDIQGAFGIHQLPRLEGLVEIRRTNAEALNAALAPYKEYLMLPSEATFARHAYFCYPITVLEGAPFTKKELADYLEAQGLETRPIESGNMAQQPAMSRVIYRAGKLPNAEYIHKNSFFFGNHAGIGNIEIEAIVSYFDDFFRERGE